MNQLYLILISLLIYTRICFVPKEKSCILQTSRSAAGQYDAGFDKGEEEGKKATKIAIARELLDILDPKTIAKKLA